MHEEPLFDLQSDDGYPREFGIPFRIGCVRDADEFNEQLSKHWGSVANLFISAHQFRRTQPDEDREFPKPVPSTVTIKLMVFDFDAEDAPERMVEEVRDFIDYLEREDWAYKPVFSGGGIHIYVKTETYDTADMLTNPKQALANAQLYLLDEAGVIEEANTDYIGKPDDGERAPDGSWHHVDGSVIGDIRQMVRIPNTFNGKEGRERWCIEVEPDLIMDGDAADAYDRLCDRAQDQPVGRDHRWWGNRFVALDEFDTSTPMAASAATTAEYDPSVGRDWRDIRFTPCMRQILQSGTPNYHQRTPIITYLKQMGVAYESAKNCLEHFLTDEKFHHVVNEEKEIHNIYSKRYRFPSKDRIIDVGICTDSCRCSYEHVGSLETDFDDANPHCTDSDDDDASQIDAEEVNALTFP